MDKITRNKKTLNFLKIYILAVALLLFGIAIVLNPNIHSKNLLITFLFFMIFIFSFTMLVKSIYQKPFSLVTMHWIFIFIFFGLSGFLQYQYSDFVYSINATDATLIYVLIIILTWMFFFYFGSKIKVLEFKKIKILNNSLSSSLKPNKLFLIIINIVSFLISMYILNKSGINSLFSRSSNDALTLENQSTSLIFSSVLSNFVLYGLVLSIIYYKKYKKGLIILTIQFICCLIANPPLGMPRFNFGIVYLGLLLLFFPSFKHGKKFIGLFLTGFIVVFPMIDTFRHTSLFEINSKDLFGTFSNFTSNFLSGHFDAFSMIINTVNYVEHFGSSYGLQLLGVFLFFIPRSIWPEKPVGSGSTVREAQGETFTNVSSPLIAEGIINFNFLGVLLFAFFIGILVKRLDNIYWFLEKNNSNISYIQLLYPFLISMFFFINRGDLLSSFAYTMGHIVVFTVIFILNNMLFIKSSKL